MRVRPTCAVILAAWPLPNRPQRAVALLLRMACDVYFSGRTDASLSGADMKNNPMTCEKFIASLQAFRDDELTWPDRIRAQEHLAACAKCSGYVRGYKQTIELAKRCASGSDDLAALPESLVRKIWCGRSLLRARRDTS